MEERRNNRKVENRLKDALRHDRARIQVGRISHFGLLEMSRQRLRTGVLEGSTSQCPHCQGTGIIRSVESVSLAVLRALEDQLLRDARNSLTAVTTADVALYILNNKRAFVTDMERRYGITIAVQASDRMQGANFAIERSAVQLAPQRTVERAVVNMESGFEGQEGEEEPVAEEAAEAPAERDDGGRRSRRRRRRGRRDDRPDDRAPYRGGERAEFARNGEADEMRPEHADANREPQPRHDLAEPLDEPAGTGEQPSIAHGDSDREGGRGDQRDRPRRRRGRRGGRRGRDRDEAPRDQTDELGARPAEESGNGAGAHEDREPEAQAPAVTATAEPIPYAEPRHEAAAVEARPERSWRASDSPDVQAEAPPEPAAPTPAPAMVEPTSPPPQPSPEEASAPARKGWWQRKFSGE
jgi:ribonuclease E